MHSIVQYPLHHAALHPIEFPWRWRGALVLTPDRLIHEYDTDISAISVH